MEPGLSDDSFTYLLTSQLVSVGELVLLPVECGQGPFRMFDQVCHGEDVACQLFRVRVVEYGC